MLDQKKQALVGVFVLLFSGTASGSNCRDFDCSVYSNWKGGCEATSCGVYKCQWLNEKCVFGNPQPPADILDCSSPANGNYCTNVAILYKKRTPGQALDIALARNESKAKTSCHGPVVSYKNGEVDVKVVSLVNGNTTGPILEIEVRQSYGCGPW